MQLFEVQPLSKVTSQHLRGSHGKQPSPLNRQDVEAYVIPVLTAGSALTPTGLAVEPEVEGHWREVDHSVLSTQPGGVPAISIKSPCDPPRRVT